MRHTLRIVLVALLTLTASAALSAQQRPAGETLVLQPFPATEPLRKTPLVVGNFGGGAAGALIGAAAGAGVAHLAADGPSSDSGMRIGILTGSLIGYGVGAAAGSWLAAERQGGAPHYFRVFAGSAAGALAGAMLWSVIGTSFGSVDEPVIENPAWKIGITFGLGAHALVNVWNVLAAAR